MKIKKIIILLLVAIMLPVISKAFEITIDTNKKEIKKGEELILSIKNSENVIAGNFEINYNKEVFVEGINIECAEKDEKIACIYGDISGQGTEEFKIKFKAKKAGKKGAFSINNAKIRVESQDESYKDENIIGIDKETVVKVKGNSLIKYLIIVMVIVVIIIGMILVTHSKNRYHSKKIH